MNYNQITKYHALAQRLYKPRSTSDLNIYFMECMEQIEFAGNDNLVRERYSQLFHAAREFWYPEADKYDFFDELYNQTEELVA
jgi:hypothetical protein